MRWGQYSLLISLLTVSGITGCKVRSNSNLAETSEPQKTALVLSSALDAKRFIDSLEDNELYYFHEGSKKCGPCMRFFDLFPEKIVVAETYRDVLIKRFGAGRGVVVYHDSNGIIDPAISKVFKDAGIRQNLSVPTLELILHRKIGSVSIFRTQKFSSVLDVESLRSLANKLITPESIAYVKKFRS